MVLYWHSSNVIKTVQWRILYYLSLPTDNTVWCLGFFLDWILLPACVILAELYPLNCVPLEGKEAVPHTCGHVGAVFRLFHWRDDAERRVIGGLLSLPLLCVIEATQGVRLHSLRAPPIGNCELEPGKE